MQETLSRLRAEHPGAAAQAAAISGGLYYGVRTRWFSDGGACFRAMLEDLRTAEKSIHLACGSIHPGVMWETVLTVLRQKAAGGIDVRLVYDGLLSRLPLGYEKRLAGMRIQCRVTYGARPYRAMVIDGALAYTGSMDISDGLIGLRCRIGEPPVGVLRIRGDAVASISAWILSRFPDGLEIPAAPTVPDYGYLSFFPDTSAVIPGLIQRAERRVLLMTPRILPGRTRNALRLAAASGVETLIITGRLPRSEIPGAQILRFPDRVYCCVCCADGQTAALVTGRGGVWLHGSGTVSGMEADLRNLFHRCAPGLNSHGPGHTPGRTGGIEHGQGDFQTGDRGASAGREAL